MPLLSILYVHEKLFFLGSRIPGTFEHTHLRKQSGFKYQCGDTGISSKSGHFERGGSGVEKEKRLKLTASQEKLKFYYHYLLQIKLQAAQFDLYSYRLFQVFLCNLDNKLNKKLNSTPIISISIIVHLKNLGLHTENGYHPLWVERMNASRAAWRPNSPRVTKARNNRVFHDKKSDAFLSDYLTDLKLHSTK